MPSDPLDDFQIPPAPAQSAVADVDAGSDSLLPGAIAGAVLLLFAAFFVWVLYVGILS